MGESLAWIYANLKGKWEKTVRATIASWKTNKR